MGAGIHEICFEFGMFTPQASQDVKAATFTVFVYPFRRVSDICRIRHSRVEGLC